jgi:hypothetical protein
METVKSGQMPQVLDGRLTRGQNDGLMGVKTRVP